MALDIESITSVIKEGIPALEVLAGSKAVALFLEKVSGALGWYVEPKQIVRKARAEAAASLIKAETEQEVKTLEQRTTARIVYEETRLQQNIEAVVMGALAGINNDAKPELLDEDWLTNFFNKCRLISNDDVQKIWSHILSGEVNEPGAFSPKTLHLLSTLTKDDIFSFKRMCSYVWVDEESKPVIIVTLDWMEKFGGTFSVLNKDILRGNDSGLLTWDNSTEQMLYGHDVYFSYGGHQFSLKEMVDGQESSIIDSGIPVGYIKLTLEGRELSKICSPEINLEYMNEVVEYWIANGLIVSEQSV